MRISTFLEVLWAASQTHRVQSRFKQRGGIFLVSLPGQLKTTLLRITEDSTIGVLGLSDLTTTMLVEARDSIAANKIHTLAFYDFQKIFERKADTASNILGNIRALMDEGFTTAAFEKAGAHGVIQQRARALIMAAITPKFYRDHLSEWCDQGMGRRAIFCVYKLRNPEVITEAIMRELPIDLATVATSVPSNLQLDARPMDDPQVEKLLMRMLRHQPGDEVPLILLKKIYAVLQWKYKVRLKQKDKAGYILSEFSEALGPEGAELVIDCAGGSKNGKG